MGEVGTGQLAVLETRLGQLAALPAGVVQVATVELRFQQVGRFEDRETGAAAFPLAAFQAGAEERGLDKDAALEDPVIEHHARQVGAAQVHADQAQGAVVLVDQVFQVSALQGAAVDVGGVHEVFPWSAGMDLESTLQHREVQKKCSQFCNWLY